MFAVLAASQAPSGVLEPTEPWTLSPQDDGCTVARAFGNDPVIQIGFQTTMQSRPAFLLVRGPKKLLPEGIGEIQLSLDGAKPEMVHFGSFATNETGVRLTKLFPDDATMTRLAGATTMTIGEKLAPLHVTDIGAAMQAINRCTSDKLSSWGVDPDLYFQRRTATITGNFAGMFGAQSYPKEARKKGASGRVVVLLRTDKTGAITNCKVVASPDPSLNAGTCEVAMRGRAKPPLDAAGQPIASFAVVPIVWTRP